ncbi:iron-containing redox enzyme family protein [Paeniglutamicibacter antarcticus]|uniref:Iron-containing redox enzyme family protein n=1 Tax=Paeniglutamicibacter antarcticus TaxID=494023 RepID=A0ABP9TLS2_9MICC
MQLPRARGPVGSALIKALETNDLEVTFEPVRLLLDAALADGDILYDDDLQLTLFMLYELHYSGFEGISDRWEWHPPLLTVRGRLEDFFEARLREGAGNIPAVEPRAHVVAEALFDMAKDNGGPSVATFVARHASMEQTKEFLIHKSVYQLKEADPHTWAIPRLTGRAKSAMVEIQTDEYGGGRPGQMHSELFARTMEGLDLDSTFGAYIDQVPAISLASVNAMSLFGLHRRFRGAICGHLAIYEMTSSIPNARYARGFRRLGFKAPVTDYFDEHVEADAAHEQIAGRDLAGGLIEHDPNISESVFFGAAAVCFLDELVGRWQLSAWEQDRSSLRESLVQA